HRDARPVTLGVNELALPTAAAAQRVGDALERFGERGLQKLVGDLADRLRGLPSVELLRAAVPVRDDVVHVADEDGVVREVEKAGLLAQRFLALLALEGDARDLGEAVDHAVLVRRGVARLAIVDGEGPKDLALRGK